MTYDFTNSFTDINTKYFLLGVLQKYSIIFSIMIVGFLISKHAFYDPRIQMNIQVSVIKKS